MEDDFDPAVWADLFDRFSMVAPPSRLDADENEVLQAVMEAARSAFHDSDAHIDDTQTVDDPDGEDCRDPLGTVGHRLLLDGRKTRLLVSYARLLLEISDGLAGGIERLVGELDDNQKHRIERLTRVAVGAGYMVALLDDRHARRRKSVKATIAKKTQAQQDAEDIRETALANPGATQQQIADALGFKRGKVQKALSQQQ